MQLIYARVLIYHGMNQKRPAIGILTAPFGAGHQLAAEAVRQSLQSSCDARVFDPFSRLPVGAGQRLVKAYLDLLRYTPDLWRLVYNGTGELPLGGALQNILSQGLWLVLGSIFEHWVQENRPQAVVATHPFTAALANAWLMLRRETKQDEEQDRKRGQKPGEEQRQGQEQDFPFFVVTTDFAPHPFWFYPTVTSYCVATPDFAHRLVQMGIPAERIQVTGIPVRQQFVNPPDRQTALCCLGLAGPSGETGQTGQAAMTEPAGIAGATGHEPLVLLMGGGLGVGRYKDILRGLLTVSVPLHLVIFTGQNQKLYRSLHLFLEESPVSHHRIDILQYTENIVDWMAAADILVTKPGGLTLAEALTVGVPLVLIDPVPGHEEENAEYVVMTGAALTATTSSLPAVVQELLAHQDLRLRLRRAARNLARPDAAQRIAQIVSAAVTL